MHIDFSVLMDRTDANEYIEKKVVFFAKMFSFVETLEEI